MNKNKQLLLMLVLSVMIMITFDVHVTTMVAAYNVPAIFSFGDSIFDAGNNRFKKDCTIQANFTPYGQNYFHHPTGRFTNGRTVPDFFCQFLGIDLQKPFLQAAMEVNNNRSQGYPSNGINFASAGSGVMNATNADEGVMPIHQQLEQFKLLMSENRIDKKLVQQSLFLFESGSNDIFNYFIPFETPTLDPDAFVDVMLEEVRYLIDQIYQLGARRIGIFSLGPVGCVPARTLLPGAPVTKCFGKMNKMIKKYNKGLETIVMGVPLTHPGAVAVYGAVYDVVQRFRAIPQRYGFWNTSSACCGVGVLKGMAQCGKDEFSVCENPNEYLFWDFFHPSEHTYKLLSKALWSGKPSRIRPFNIQALANMTVVLPP
ncbi:hypothetical protein MKX01_030281 [Papaver californicum]|nr:hypothetical protein MKX01_030281 [Papaver californicum]